MSAAVFISYASEDAAAAARLATALRAAGVEVWLDVNELKGGDAWDRRIRGQVAQCTLFIAVISAATQARREGYFRREWRLAADRTHDMSERVAFLLPVVIDRTDARSADVPDAFRSVQWTHAPGGQAPADFARHVSRLLSGEAGPDAAVPPQPGAATSTPRRARPWVLGGAAVVLLLLVVIVVRLASFGGHARGASATEPPVAAAVGAHDTDSIAVLPFVDMSEKRDQEYFADGLAEELIDHLVRARDLKVIARTSSFQFKGKDQDIRAIARQLGVAHLLEGSVRFSAGTVRVTAQLVQASDGTHLWSQTYERRLTDIFRVQDEISTAVAAALRTTLLQAPADRRSTNIEAYNLLLKGNFFYSRRHAGDAEKAIDQYRQALALDPDYAQAWDRLARVYLEQHYESNRGDAAQESRITDALHTALNLDPHLVSAHVSLAEFNMNVRRDWAAARRELVTAHALDPVGTDGRQARGTLILLEAIVSGRMDEVVRDGYQELDRDPLDRGNIYFLSWMLMYARHYDEARTMQRRMFELDPLAIKIHEKAAKTLVLLGDAPGALQEAAQETDVPGRLSAEALAYAASHQPADADAALQTLQTRYPIAGAYYIAEAYAYRGQPEEAFHWLDKAVESNNTSVVFFRSSPFFDGLKREPRYGALLRRLNMPP